MLEQRQGRLSGQGYLMKDPSGASAPTEHFDVVVVGAGISGINASYHLRQQCPGTRFVVLETLHSFGGTWLSHTYPGIRSDSDLFTFGYSFKPWTGPPIATAQEILSYLGEVITENDLARDFRYRHQITSARWSSDDQRWTVTATQLDTGETHELTANFLYMGQGYYRHNEGYWPDWSDMALYQGRLVHSEEWTDDIEYAGKQVLVIGSGASAATIVPNTCEAAAHVTMLQRSPTFFRTGRNAIEIADALRKIDVDPAWIHEITRKQITFEGAEFARRAYEEPEAVKEELIGEVRALLGPDYDVEKHFTPRYRPWRQRIAFVPDNDLFTHIAAGRVSVETDEIDRFTQTGVLLKSGKALQADLIIAATGFNLNAFGDIAFEVDGAPVDFNQTLTYRGMMCTGLPNMVSVFGYLRASWTLRADLVAGFFCRLLAHMQERQATSVQVALRPEDADMPLGDWITDDNFNANYIKRGLPLMPRSGDKPEWQHTQNYWRDKDEIPAIDLSGAEFVYR